MTPPLPPTRGSGGASAPEETSAAVLRTFSSDRSFVGASPQPIDPTSLALPSAIVVRNASAIPEPGATLGSISVGQSPVGVAYDPSDGLVYVTDFGGGAVTALNGTTEVATIPVGTDPYGVTYDPFDQQVYVTNNGADSVSVLRGTSVVSTISLPPSSSPEGIAADPYNGEVYVADSGTDNVSVLSSGAIAATVRVGTAPDGVAYHSGNGDMYVANNQANTVSVINGTTVVKTITVGSSPGGLAYDPVSSLMYVADLAGGNVTALLGMASFATIKVGSGPDGVAFDPANGFAYVSNRGSNTVSALNRTTVSATLSVGTYPEGLAYYPPTGSLFVADNSVDTLSIVSTVLVETPSVITDRGSDVTATDVNQSVLVSSFLPGLGAGGETVRYHVDPSPGFGCGTQVNFSVPNGIGVLNLSCVPTAVGIYTIWLNVTDADANTVWTYFSIPVEPALLVPAPQVSALVLSGTPSADVNQSVNLDVRPSGGSGVYLVYQWFGLPGTGCSGTSGATVTCRFPSPGTFAPAVEVIDSNLAVTVGSSTSLTIYPDPMAPPPVANRSAWDVGQSVRFTETPRGGPGTFNAYTWSGLSPSTCTALTSSSPV
ncbi:MAG TPA: YncE family protein [Thermoplasmata archaeon]|nr:YncE family protein [Thermoplasmata archaeon]